MYSDGQVTMPSKCANCTDGDVDFVVHEGRLTSHFEPICLSGRPLSEDCAFQRKGD